MQFGRSPLAIGLGVVVVAIAAVGIGAAFVMFALTPPIKRLMGGVN